MKLWNKFAAKRAENVVISGGRSKRPQNRPNTPQVLSDVHNSATQEKKLQTGAAVCGRSMVEMLGVLAIVGVLSVGAISGYNTAMYKHRMNKTIQAVTDFLQNLAELSTKNWGGSAISEPTQYVKYGLLPASMCPEDYVSVWGGCKLPLGGIGDIYFTNEPFLLSYFWIYFYEGDIVKSCVNFLSHGWQNMYPQEWLRTNVEGCGSYIHVFGENGDQILWAVEPEIIGGGKKDITLSDIQNACDLCKGGELCWIQMIISE